MKVLKFQDSAHIKLALQVSETRGLPQLTILQVLGLMCDGQFRLMQNYLREQRDNIVTINLVGEVALFAQVYTYVCVTYYVQLPVLFCSAGAPHPTDPH